MPSLYNITDRYLALVDDEELDEQQIADTLEGIADEIEVKAQNIARVDSQWQSYADAVGDMIKKLQQRQKMFLGKKKALRNYLMSNMERLDYKKITCPDYTITLAKGVQSVHVVNESDLPDKYLKLKSEWVVDKRALLADLKAGEVIPGAELVTGENSIRIKQ